MPAGIYPRKSVEERFWPKVNKNGPVHPILKTHCWLWTVSLFPDGYGQFRIESKCIRAHRYSYELHYGEIPEGLCILHRCDNRICVNPNHLRSGTKQENTDDMIQKGRVATGERHGSKTHPERVSRGESHAAKTYGELNGRAKLTEVAVIHIRKLSKEGITIPQLARQFQVSRIQINRIIKRVVWRRVK